MGTRGESAAGFYISVSMEGLGLRSVTSPSRSPSSSDVSGGGGGPEALLLLVSGRLHDVVWVMWLSQIRDKKTMLVVILQQTDVFLTPTASSGISLETQLSFQA